MAAWLMVSLWVLLSGFLCCSNTSGWMFLGGGFVCRREINPFAPIFSHTTKEGDKHYTLFPYFVLIYECSPVSPEPSAHLFFFSPSHLGSFLSSTLREQQSRGGVKARVVHCLTFNGGDLLHQRHLWWNGVTSKQQRGKADWGGGHVPDLNSS